MKLAIVFGIIMILLLVGCVTQQQGAGLTSQGQAPTPRSCHTVYEDNVSTKEDCNDVSFTEQICNNRKLNYSSHLMQQVDMCVASGSPCAYKTYQDCPCNSLITRCRMVVKNEDKEKSGVWTVGANFSYKNLKVVKDPVSQEIGPNENYTFEFTHTYSAEVINFPATCSLYVTKEPSVFDCHEETRVRTVCRNVTTTTPIQTEVCG